MGGREGGRERGRGEGRRKRIKQQKDLPFQKSVGNASLRNIRDVCALDPTPTVDYRKVDTNKQCPQTPAK